MGEPFVQETDSDMGKINPFIAENIDFKNPEKGEVIFRMRQLAKENGINYKPSMEMQMALNQYLDRTGQGDPFDEMKAYQYNPSPPSMPPSMPPSEPPSQPPPSFPPPSYPPPDHPPSNYY
mmetsp:Transcript_3705/g.6319  ORF Transcript_3705/g.6319 Transcript_3705/m.6319 type:complete len:121 (+) Transcript_3705:432-794(+)